MELGLEEVASYGAAFREARGPSVSLLQCFRVQVDPSYMHKATSSQTAALV